uniref:basic proline-rich protein-like n=1 Tax=Panthera onca TaxID=9690 RepID=UPI002954FDD4|nr:basic proline-rich protein-like [Panthera onca]
MEELSAGSGQELLPPPPPPAARQAPGPPRPLRSRRAPPRSGPARPPARADSAPSAGPASQTPGRAHPRRRGAGNPRPACCGAEERPRLGRLLGSTHPTPQPRPMDLQGQPPSTSSSSPLTDPSGPSTPGEELSEETRLPKSPGPLRKVFGSYGGGVKGQSWGTGLEQDLEGPGLGGLRSAVVELRDGGGPHLGAPSLGAGAGAKDGHPHRVIPQGTHPTPGGAQRGPGRERSNRSRRCGFSTSASASRGAVLLKGPPLGPFFQAMAPLPPPPRQGTKPEKKRLCDEGDGIPPQEADEGSSGPFGATAPASSSCRRRRCCCREVATEQFAGPQGKRVRPDQRARQAPGRSASSPRRERGAQRPCARPFPGPGAPGAYTRRSRETSPPPRAWCAGVVHRVPAHFLSAGSRLRPRARPTGPGLPRRGSQRSQRARPADPTRGAAAAAPAPGRGVGGRRRVPVGIRRTCEKGGALGRRSQAARAGRRALCPRSPGPAPACGRGCGAGSGRRGAAPPPPPLPLPPGRVRRRRRQARRV